MGLIKIFSGSEILAYGLKEKLEEKLRKDEAVKCMIAA